jgi:propionyl-CoA carboxylase alpha chain
MNTRLQVEHPVTECVTGLDLVRLQITIAEGDPLPFTETPPARGHAIEVRLYAEDPAHDWRPSTGTIHRFAVPSGPPDPHTSLRVDSGVADGSVVSIHYDPLLAKVIAWAPTRGEAARVLAAALAGAEVHGVVTNRDLLTRVLRTPEFLAGGTDTDFLARHPEVFTPLLAAEADRGLAGLAAALAGVATRRESAPWAGLPAGWRNVASAPSAVSYEAPWGRVEITYRLDRYGRLVTWSASTAPGPARAERAQTGTVSVVSIAPDRVVLDVAGLRQAFRVHTVDSVSYVDSPAGSAAFVEVPRFSPPADERAAGSLLAPVPGMVGRVAVEAGQRVRAGDLMLTLEAMKLEHAVHAPEPGVVVELPVRPGTQVEAGALLAVLGPDEGEE